MDDVNYEFMKLVCKSCKLMKLENIYINCAWMEMYRNEYVIEIYGWYLKYEMIMRIIDDIFIVKYYWKFQVGE